ncbi:hypothetical protein JWG45_14610, partial [Leptospira sp. 201903070]
GKIPETFLYHKIKLFARKNSHVGIPTKCLSLGTILVVSPLKLWEGLRSGWWRRAGGKRSGEFSVAQKTNFVNLKYTILLLSELRQRKNLLKN